MLKKTLTTLVTLVILTGCFLQKKTKQEIWQNAPDATTTKIRVITHLSNNDLKRAYIDRLVHARLDPDPNLGLNPMTTKVKAVENYYVELFVTFQDSVATVYGNAGFPGLNSLGQQPSASNIAWDPIRYNGRGWETMSIAGVLAGSRTEYNAFH